MTVYNHHMFPVRYHNALFVADWSEGRILAIHLKRDGATYTANSEVFLEGQPLNATDVEVGPDGWLYFITGGRGTSGGVYRVRWRGQVPEAVRDLGDELTSVIRYPQIDSAWARQAVASIKNKMGDRWDDAVIGVAATKTNPPHYRTRALDLMQLFGPSPSVELLVDLSQDSNETVRAKSAALMGLHVSDETTERLREMLSDGDRAVRREACEALARAGETASWDELRKMLAADDRHEAWAARRLLERVPVDEWREEALTAADHRLAIQGGLALVLASPEKETAQKVIARLRSIIEHFVSDRDFIDILRVMQVAIVRTGLNPDDLPELKADLIEEFPSGSDVMNREIIRLLAFLNASSISDRYLAYLSSEAPFVERLHAALQLRFIKGGWSDDQSLALLKFYEEASKQEGGNSYAQYVGLVTRDFAKTLSAQQSRMLLAKGDEWPSAALGALYSMPEEIDDETFRQIKELDRKLASRSGEDVQKLKIGLAAVLARCGDDKCMGYLRDIWDSDPERREAVAMGLAQAPDGANYRYLVNSLPVLSGAAAQEVLMKLNEAEPDSDGSSEIDPEAVRQVILLGLKLKDNGAEHAVTLLQKWTGENPSTVVDNAQESLKDWQKWFATTYPELPEARLPEADDAAKYKFEELIEYLGGEEGKAGSAARGGLVFTKANCHQCHRFGDRGESMGPDLSSVAKRFTRREILESIYYPSHIISSQYAAKTIVTKKGVSHTGIVAQGAAGEMIVLGLDGRMTIIAEDQIEETLPSKKSAMPDGLLNPLTLEEIADLFAYLGTSPRSSVSVRPVVEAVKEATAP
jgi:putative heme-binding domain-containing protein